MNCINQLLYADRLMSLWRVIIGWIRPRRLTTPSTHPTTLPPAINLSYAVISDGATVILINTLSKSAQPLSAEAARSGSDTGPCCNMCVLYKVLKSFQKRTNVALDRREFNTNLNTFDLAVIF